MSVFKCQSCGAIDSRVSNIDNCICTECGTFDDFTEAETVNEYLEENIDRMVYLSNIIRDELSYGRLGSSSAELDSYMSEIKQMIKEGELI